MFFISGLHRWGWALPKGGSGELTKALAACLLDNGGIIKTSSPVKSVKVEGGEARSVILDTGEEIEANKAIVSNVNVKQLFLHMLSLEELPLDFTDKVRHIKHTSYSCVLQNIALNEAPIFRAGLAEGVNQSINRTWYINICPFMEEFLRMFDEFKFGIPSTKAPTVGVSTLFDPSRAPEGRHTLYLVQFEPYELKDGGAAKWDEIKQEVADGVLEEVRKYTTNMGGDNILSRWIQTPLDISRSNHAMIDGDIGHIAHFLTQTFANRPLPGWGRYRTPIKRLYMCGASTHPGLGVTGGGRASVQVVMEDLGIDFKKVIAR